MEVYFFKCDDSIEFDFVWYIFFCFCVVVFIFKVKKLGLGLILKWFERLNVVLERIFDVYGGSVSGLKYDDGKWKNRVKYYKKVLLVFGMDKIRNVMDMNIVYGGFVVVFVQDFVWVMNVVLFYSVNMFFVVFDCGFIGMYYDWYGEFLFM